MAYFIFYIIGHVGWGIAWYINGLLIPEIHVVRGKTYTFVIEGGQDPNQPAVYHPFYITDDPEGGYEFMTEDRKRKVFKYTQNSMVLKVFFSKGTWCMCNSYCSYGHLFPYR